MKPKYWEQPQPQETFVWELFLTWCCQGWAAASQGKLPSTIWGEQVLREMKNGLRAEAAVDYVSKTDNGKEDKQLLGLDINASRAMFSGNKNMSVISEIVAENCLLAGNMLRNKSVIEACYGGYLNG